MPSAGEDVDDAIGVAEAAGNSTRKNRRRMISDYLAGDSDGGEAEAEAAPPSPPETPPQLRLPRFTCATFRFARLGRKRGARKEAVLGVKIKTDAASASVDVDSSAGSKPAESSSISASAGMGLSMLLLLLARTCVELNRMAEVRAQMEALLREIRDEAAGRVKVAVAPATTRAFNDLQLSPSSSCTSDTDTCHRRATTSSSAEGTTIPPARGRECESDRPAENGELQQPQAVAEFEAQDSPTVECSAERENSYDTLSSDDEFIELDGDGGRFGGGGGERSWSASDEDSEGDSTAGARDAGRVCAVELERRLHEVLHRRNRDRIEELESALRRAEQRLREKEMEARLWQDTATLALQPPAPRDGHSY